MLLAKNALSITRDEGFALGQFLLDEAELFLIMTEPKHRSQGVGRRMLALFEEQAFKNEVRRIILEVSATNIAARALYTSTGYQEIAVRKNYYTFPNGSQADAIVMEKHLLKTDGNTE
jgi:ribosomal-protein-alanine N-acetyltransferase